MNKESSELDYKAYLDVNSPGEWIELIKDIVAMYNTSGGILIIGIEDDGTYTTNPDRRYLQIDPATIVDKIFKYTSVRIPDLKVIHQKTEDGHETLEVIVKKGIHPLIFTNPGTYAIGTKQKTAFALGTLYFRHGAKSEPGDSHDLKKFLDERLEREREVILENIQKYLSAPIGSIIKVLESEVYESDNAEALAVQITENPTAPKYYLCNLDKSHPYRLKELTSEINKRISEKNKITSHHIQCVRKVYNLDNNILFISKSKYTSPRYSDKLLIWLLDQYGNDPNFFDDAVRKDRNLTSQI